MISAMSMIPVGEEEGTELREKCGPVFSVFFSVFLFGWLVGFLSDDNVCQGSVTLF